MSDIASEDCLRKELVAFGRRLHRKEFISGTDGNLSARIDDFRVLCTPTGVSKGMMRPEEMVVVDLNGHQISGRLKASSEIDMHLKIYKTRSDIHAVVHAHPCTATGFASAGVALDEPLCSEIVIALKGVPLAPYKTPGTPGLSDALAPYIPGHNAILMANHGVVTYGRDILQAYLNMETVEHFARICVVARLLGSKRLLEGEDLRQLYEARERYKAVGQSVGD